MTPVAQATPPVSQPMATPISADMMSPSGVRISLGGPRAERRNSHTGQPPLDDQSEWGTQFLQLMIIQKIMYTWTCKLN